MKKIFFYTLLILVLLKPAYALALEDIQKRVGDIIRECHWEVHVKDYTGGYRNKWRSFDHEQNFKLTIKDTELIIYDYKLEKNWGTFKIVSDNNIYIIAVKIFDFIEGPSVDSITYNYKDGYTVLLSNDFEFGITAQTGWCK